jgi:hypothetical protein
LRLGATRICKSLDFEYDAASCGLTAIYQIGFVIGGSSRSPALLSAVSVLVSVRFAF